MKLKLTHCRYCRNMPQLVQPYKEHNSNLWQVRCSCGAYGWSRATEKEAARTWGGDEKGNGYNQLK